jgi:hypothetical protein
LSIDYYGDGQHALHVDEATIEDDNGTFTCLALNAAGRVQITADVFVHEKGNTLIFIFILLRKKNKKRYLHTLYLTYSSFLLLNYIEVIDVPRHSPLVKTQPRLLKQRQTTNRNFNMNSDQQNDDAPPTISPPVSPIARHTQSDNEEQNTAKRYMDKFKSDRSSKLLESKLNEKNFNSSKKII